MIMMQINKAFNICINKAEYRMTFEYKTIEKPIENTLLKEKGSKFIGFAYPVNNESELKNALEKVGKNILRQLITVMLSEWG
jgi:hypothetical protein